MKDDFFFVIGSFNNFNPSDQNLADWAANFKVFGAARYSTENQAEDGSPTFPNNRFSRERNLVDNFEFTTSDRVYIWGFNLDPESRETSEWILITKDDWFWPAAATGAGGDPGIFSVDDINSYPADELLTAVYGNLREDGDANSALMTSAAVSRDLRIPRLDYDNWVLAFFPDLAFDEQGVNREPEDDFDSDGLTNYEEFIAGFDPILPLSRDEIVPVFSLERITTAEGTFFSGSIVRSPLANLTWTIEESTTLQTQEWDDLSMTGMVVSDTPGLLQVQSGVSVESDPSRARFFRLRIAQ